MMGNEASQRGSLSRWGPGRDSWDKGRQRGRELALGREEDGAERAGGRVGISPATSNCPSQEDSPREVLRCKRRSPAAGI